jgi:tight adherence protein C
MDPMIVASFAVALAGAAVLVVGLRNRPAGDLADRLAHLDATEAASADPILADPLPVRLLGPAAAAFTGRVASLLPRERLARLQQRLATAGLNGRISAEEFLAIQALAFVGGIALAGLLLTSPTMDGPRKLAAALLGLVIGAIAPTAWLSRAETARTESIRRDLPDALDLLAISVEAGVGLEGAMEVVTRNFDSALAAELQLALREMELGLSRRDALHHLRERADLPELSSFVGSLLQADALGMPLSRVLRVQADELRVRRRQRARETAAKLPVKLLFPMTLFILPAIFIVTLGPAAIQLLRVFG